MALKQSDLCEEEPHFSYLGPWHANLIHIDRRKCVLFVNDKTLFNFMVPDLSKAQIRDLDKLFKSYLSVTGHSTPFCDPGVTSAIIGTSATTTRGSDDGIEGVDTCSEQAERADPAQRCAMANTGQCIRTQRRDAPRILCQARCADQHARLVA